MSSKVFEQELIKRMKENISSINKETEKRMREDESKTNDIKCGSETTCRNSGVDSDTYFSDKVMNLYGKVTVVKMLMDKYFSEHEKVDWEEAYNVFRDMTNF